MFLSLCKSKKLPGRYNNHSYQLVDNYNNFLSRNHIAIHIDLYRRDVLKVIHQIL